MKKIIKNFEGGGERAKKIFGKYFVEKNILFLREKVLTSVAKCDSIITGELNIFKGRKKKMFKTGDELNVRHKVLEYKKVDFRRHGVEGIFLVIKEDKKLGYKQYVTWATKEGSLFWGHYFLVNNSSTKELLQAHQAAYENFNYRCKRGY